MKNYLEATVWAADRIEEVVKDGELDFPEYTFADAVTSVSLGIGLGKNHLSNSGPYYVVTDEIAVALLELADNHYQFFDACVSICATNILTGNQLPSPFRLFAANVLEGKVKRPSPRHRERQKNWLAKSFIYETVLAVVEKFELKKTRNDASESTSACDVVAGALSTCGVRTNYSEVKDIMTHPRYNQLRREFVAVDKILRRANEFENAPNVNAFSPGYSDTHLQLSALTVLDILATFSRSAK